MLEKEKQEYLEKHFNRQYSNTSDTSNHDSPQQSTSSSNSNEMKILQRSEVIRKLRERCEPILLFAETESDAFYRLRQLEITAPEVNRGFRNDFQVRNLIKIVN